MQSEDAFRHFERTCETYFSPRMREIVVRCNLTDSKIEFC